jgi:hypothetical protein
MAKNKKRSRKKRKLKRDKETRQEHLIRTSKSRGGRAGMVITDKTKYNRKKKHKGDEE